MSTILKSLDTKSFLYEIQGGKNLELPQVLRERKNVLDLKIVILLDVSGSVSQETFENFMKQIDGIRGLSMVKVIEFESRVVAMYDYFKTPQNEVMRLTGGGGTEFVPAFEQAKKMGPSAIIIMTDGLNSDDVDNPNIPTGLVLTEKGKHSYSWMKKIAEIPNDKANRNGDSAEGRQLDKEMKADNDELSGLEIEPEDEFEDEED